MCQASEKGLSLHPLCYVLSYPGRWVGNNWDVRISRWGDGAEKWEKVWYDTYSLVLFCPTTRGLFYILTKRETAKKWTRVDLFQQCMALTVTMSTFVVTQSMQKSDIYLLPPSIYRQLHPLDQWHLEREMIAEQRGQPSICIEIYDLSEMHHLPYYRTTIVWLNSMYQTDFSDSQLSTLFCLLGWKWKIIAVNE